MDGWALTPLFICLLNSSYGGADRIAPSSLPSRSAAGPLARICGTFPHTYFYNGDGPCPEDEGASGTKRLANGVRDRPELTCSQGGRPLGIECSSDKQCGRFRDFDTVCDAGQCCSMPDEQTLYWETCENGGYFVSSPCQSDSDCVANTRATSQLANENQICLSNECCTVPMEGAQAGWDTGMGNIDQAYGAFRCDNGGYYLEAKCMRHADCNRIPSLSLGPTQQIACASGFCCIMPRRLPPGARDWPDVCPSGGSFLGTFCDVDLDCGMGTGRICALSTYCCTNPLQPEVAIGSWPLGGATSVWPSGVGGGYDALAVGYGYCYNGQRSRIQCLSPARCQSSQLCINELCCTATGDEWQNACGGDIAHSDCLNGGVCGDSLFCTSSNFCCECPYGQAAGKCSHGCPPSYVCEENGFCCPRCMDGNRPFGSCYNNLCSEGYVCKAGNICCRA